MKKSLIGLLMTAVAVVLTGCGHGTAEVEMNDESDVSGKRIILLAGSIYDIEMTPRQDVTLERYQTVSDMIAALKSGKGDALLHDEICLSPSDRRRHGMKIAFRTDQSFEVAYAFHQDDAETVEAFNVFLSEIRQNGLFDEIYHRWFDTEAPDTVSMPAADIEKATGSPLRLSVSVLVAPMFFRNGSEWKGFEVELMQRFANQAGRPLEIINYDVSAATAALATKKVNLWGGSIFVTDERKKTVLFTDPYYACHPAYFVVDKQSKTSSGLLSTLKESAYNNLIAEDRWRLIADGLWKTIVISLFSLLLGTLLAAIVCWMRMSRRKWLSKLAVVYIDLMRGIPLLVVLLLMFYIVLARTGLNATTVAIISFSMVFAAYVSEMFRTAIESVGKGQTEAGVALGFTPLQTFWYIILPQAVNAVMPVYKGEAVSLFKNTSIVGYIAIQDLTKASELIRSRTFDAFFPLIVITIIYFLLAWLLGKALDLTVKNKTA